MQIIVYFNRVFFVNFEQVLSSWKVGRISMPKVLSTGEIPVLRQQQRH